MRFRPALGKAQSSRPNGRSDWAAVWGAHFKKSWWNADCTAKLRNLALAALLLYPQAAHSAAEYEIKASFLYKLANFVSWPGEITDRPFCIGVLGQDPFGPLLERAIQGKTAEGRSFTVRRFKTVQEIETCEMVFISSSGKGRLSSVLDHLKGFPVLTVGDAPEFCESGGIINMLLAGDRVHLQINLDAAERANLQISSKLLNLASVVRCGSSLGTR